MLDARVAASPAVDGELLLPFELRAESRLRTTLATARRSGSSSSAARCCAAATACAATTGASCRVRAADEDVMDARCDDADAARARRLPSRQPPRAGAVGDGWLRFAADRRARDDAARARRDA